MIRQTLLFSIIVFNSLLSYSQDTITTFYNFQKKETTKDNAVFYRMGIMKEDSTYTVFEYDMQDNLRMEGAFKSNRFKTKHGYFKYYYEAGSIESEGNYVNNRYSGDWIYYFPSGKKSAQDTYMSDLRIKTIFWDENGAEVPSGEAEYPPQYPGGWEAYGKFVNENIQYPPECIASGIQGKVIVRIEVNQHGEIVDSHIVTSAHPLLDIEALRVANLIEHIIPGKEHNRLTKAFNIPIRFTLN